LLARSVFHVFVRLDLAADLLRLRQVREHESLLSFEGRQAVPEADIAEDFLHRTVLA